MQLQASVQDLRYTTASHLAMNGHSLLEIVALLGHKTLQMTKRYAHLSTDHIKNVGRSMSKVVAS